jgi:ribonuclease Z
VQITFLGTAGSYPTRERNPSAIALDMEKDVLLLDCGEGTQRQFYQSPVSFMRVRRIFITHFHGDHYLGLPGLVQTMGLNQRTEPLDIYGPKETTRFVEAILNSGYSYTHFPIVTHEIAPGERVAFDAYSVTAAEARHSVPALAYRIDEKERRGRFKADEARALGVHGSDFALLEEGKPVTTRTGKLVLPEQVLGPPRPGRSVVYSGDTRPAPEIIRLAEEADVLIHEATFLEELKSLADAWGHSTALGAATVAQKAGVRALYLTHFSARYPELTGSEAEAHQAYPSAIAAHDLLELQVHQR